MPQKGLNSRTMTWRLSPAPSRTGCRWPGGRAGHFAHPYRRPAGDGIHGRGVMRILLIATNRHKHLMGRMNAQPLPIGLAYIAGYLDQTRHTVKLLDLMFSDAYLDEVERTVRAFQPELVGISIRNLSNHSYLDPQWQ